MYSHAIAEQLCGRGHDVEGVTERADLRALSDTDLFTRAQSEQRAVVTENVDDFSIIAGGYDQRGQVEQEYRLAATAPGFSSGRP
jgi:hypothetical protein